MFSYFSLLKSFLREENNDTETSIQDFCQSFTEAFPESDKPSRPRTLQHLSRCAVRKSLYSSCNLPHGLKTIGLPKMMQDYISLKDEMQ